MKNKNQMQADDNFIDQKIAEAFGYGDQQLAEELDRAVAAAKEQPSTAPEGELQRIINRLDRKSAAKRRKSRMKKMLIAAAVLGVMMVGGSSWVGAKRYYKYETRENTVIDSEVIFNSSTDNLIDNSEAVSAYEEIAKELKIEVLQLSYLPDGMIFRSLTKARKRYVIEYGDGTGKLFFDQGLNDKPSSLSYVSDIKKSHKVYNSYLGQDLIVYQYELEDGGTQFSVRIKKDKQYYFLEGIDVKDIDKIVQGIKPYNN